MLGTFITIISVAIGRIAINMARRFPYPFVPTIARQLDVSVTTVQSIIALQASSGIVSPPLGLVTERYRRRSVMVSMLLMMGVAALIAGAFPHLIIFAGAMMIFGLGKVIFDPAMYSYLAENVPYKRRGMALGVGELSWAVALFIISPVGAVLLARSNVPPIQSLMLTLAGQERLIALMTTSDGLQAVFIFLGVACLLSAGFVALTARNYPIISSLNNQRLSLGLIWQVIGASSAAKASVIYSFIVALTNEIIFINYGVFMENRFTLTLALLGSLTIIISAGEVIGEITVITISDRIGKRRLTLIGTAIVALTYVLLPFSDSLTMALVILFVMFVMVEVAVVSSVPLISEVLPNNRVILLSAVAGGASVGRVSGAIIGGVIMAWTGNFLLAGVVAMLITLVGFWLIWRYVPENGD